MKIEDNLKIAIDIENLMKGFYYNIYNKLSLKQGSEPKIETILKILLNMIKAEDIHASIWAKFLNHKIAKSTDVDNQTYTDLLNKYNNLKIIFDGYVFDYDSKDVLNEIKFLIFDFEHKVEKYVGFLMSNMPKELLSTINEEIKKLNAYEQHDADLKELEIQLGSATNK